VPKAQISEQPPALPEAPPPMPRIEPATSIASRIEHVRAPLPRAAPAPRQADERSADIKTYLFAKDDLEAAPSIGPKIADRFAAIGVHTVGEFLAQDAEHLADLLDDPHFDAETLLDWQDQAKLVMTVPGLRGTHAQLLVGAGYRTARAVADADPISLSANVLKFVTTSAGKRVLREGRPPDIEKIKSWVDVAKQAVAA
jgi:predicted flap endonuclease-1-like 5' DNA nuclease